MVQYFIVAVPHGTEPSGIADNDLRMSINRCLGASFFSPKETIATSHLSTLSKASTKSPQRIGINAFNLDLYFGIQMTHQYT